eukprot:TRINITY_DN721_c0_g1_i2.p1 TRINITY_DN721_c0_g1~~TRINITY_DN721_c0_g1_i2.p1  ORF type:complete len:319 (-),score=77.66 TRINITY_DN721_c0_g1_i2:47-1003(-)
MKILFAYSLLPSPGITLSPSLSEIVVHTTVQDAISDFNTKLQEPVFLHIYDLPGLGNVNNYSMTLGMGAFHTGIEVFGNEWSFADPIGIFSCDPKDSPIGQYRATIELGETHFKSHDAVLQYLERIKEDWDSGTYHLISKNCNHFCNTLSLELVQKKLPKSVMRLGKFAKRFKGIIPTSVLTPKIAQEEENHEITVQFKDIEESHAFSGEVSSDDDEESESHKRKSRRVTHFLYSSSPELREQYLIDMGINENESDDEFQVGSVGDMIRNFDSESFDVIEETPNTPRNKAIDIIIRKASLNQPGGFLVLASSPTIDFF